MNPFILYPTVPIFEKCFKRHLRGVEKMPDTRSVDPSPDSTELILSDLSEVNPATVKPFQLTQLTSQAFQLRRVCTDLRSRGSNHPLIRSIHELSLLYAVLKISEFLFAPFNNTHQVLNGVFPFLLVSVYVVACFGQFFSYQFFSYLSFVHISLP